MMDIIIIFFLPGASRPKANMKTYEFLMFFPTFFRDRLSLQWDGVDMGQSVSIGSGEGEASP